MSLSALTVVALASTGPAGSSDVIREVGRFSDAGGSSRGGAAPSRGGAADSAAGASVAAPACMSRKLALTDVLERKGHVLLAGTAAGSLVGRKVKIILAGRRQVAAVLVGADGLFATTALLPPASIRESNSARYFAEVGRERSVDLKLTRRLVLDPPTSSAGTVTLTGEVIPPLVDPVAEIVVRQRRSCSKRVFLTRLRPRANGRFHIALMAPAGSPIVTYQLTTVVRESAHSRKGFATYSLPETVDLPPSVSAVEPAVGPTTGGTPVKIRGSGFLKGSAVTIGAAAASVEVISETEIKAKTPPGSEGGREVVVSDLGGSSSSGVKFTYVTPPTVTSVTPGEGSTLGGMEVVIKGTGFREGSTVTIGSKATLVEVASNTEIKAKTVASTAGTDEVVVSLPDGVASTSAIDFTYLAPPMVTSISPTEGSTEGETVVTITGTGFIKGARLTIGGPAAVFLVVSPSEIVAEAAKESADTDEVVVGDEYGSSRGGPSFTYVTPVSDATLRPRCDFVLRSERCPVGSTPTAPTRASPRSPKHSKAARKTRPAS